MERALILLVGLVVWMRAHRAVVAVVVCVLIGYPVFRGDGGAPVVEGLAPDPITTSALPAQSDITGTGSAIVRNDPVLAFIDAMAMPGSGMPAIEGGAAAMGAPSASISERCMALRANAVTGATITAIQGDFTLDDHAVQLRCLMTVQIERRFCSQEVRSLVARHYALYADRLDALRARAAGNKGDAPARWRETSASALHRNVTEELADLIVAGYLDQSYFGLRQSPSVQALFAHVGAIPDPCYRVKAESFATEGAERR